VGRPGRQCTLLPQQQPHVCSIPDSKLNVNALLASSGVSYFDQLAMSQPPILWIIEKQSVT
jgi:hypothetical protein